MSKSEYRRISITDPGLIARLKEEAKKEVEGEFLDKLKTRVNEENYNMSLAETDGFDVSGHLKFIEGIEDSIATLSGGN